jgi:phosphatidylinositol alpha-1,6-mannosyltransferase
MVAVLGLFSGCTAPGGIQASGRLAWQAITSADRGLFGQPAMFCYGDRGPDQPDTRSDATHLTSRPRAVIAALRRRWRADIVLVWHVQLLRLLPFFRLRRARIVVFLHGVEAWHRQPVIERRVLKNVSLFLTNSDFTWRRFVENNPEFADASHVTVPLGIGSPPSVSPPPPAATPAALMLSRLARDEDYKGHREMLAAWPLVQQRIPHAELWIAGEGDLRPDLEQLAAQLGLGRAVRFLGRVSEEEKERLIEQSRCMALPSRGEGFGLVYAEAMRVGRPCLVSTLDAGREVVDPPRCGLAVDPADRPALAEATCRLLTDGPEWWAWSHAARQRYEQQLTIEHFQQRLVSALAPVAKPRPEQLTVRATA